MEFEKLCDIIRDAMDNEDLEINENTSFVDDLGTDSLDVFQIIMGIEDEFNIEIDNEDAESIVTVGDALEQIRKAIN